MPHINNYPARSEEWRDGYTQGRKDRSLEVPDDIKPYQDANDHMRKERDLCCAERDQMRHFANETDRRRQETERRAGHTHEVIAAAQAVLASARKETLDRGDGGYLSGWFVGLEEIADLEHIILVATGERPA